LRAARILVAEDDPKTSALLRLYLENAGFSVTVCETGRKALEETRASEPDLVLLDVLLPEVNGFSVCRALRAESEIPVILLTARSTEDDKLHGLGLGADDYVTKPFSPREVVARVRAVLRRKIGPGKLAGAGELRSGPLVLDRERHEVRREGRVVAVTPTEFRLLEVFLKAPNRAFSRSELADRAFNPESATLDRTVDAHVMKLRRKIRASAKASLRGGRIETVFGLGYKFVPDESEDEE
jgi:DNA-binding response OmpR family regulator